MASGARTPKAASAGPAARTSIALGWLPSTVKPAITARSPGPRLALVETFTRVPRFGFVWVWRRYVETSKAACSIVRAVSDSPARPSARPTGTLMGAGAMMLGLEKYPSSTPGG